MIAFIVGTFLGCCVGLIIFFLFDVLKDPSDYEKLYNEELMKSNDLQHRLKMKTIESDTLFNLVKDVKND